MNKNILILVTIFTLLSGCGITQKKNFENYSLDELKELLDNTTLAVLCPVDLENPKVICEYKERVHILGNETLVETIKLLKESSVSSGVATMEGPSLNMYFLNEDNEVLVYFDLFFRNKITIHKGDSSYPLAVSDIDRLFELIEFK